MRFPQLALRELFLLVVIAAMGCGWWVERQRSLRWEGRSDALQQAIESADYRVGWSDDSVTIGRSGGDYKVYYTRRIQPSP